MVGDAYENVWIQRDRAPVHFGLNIRNFLNEYSIVNGLVKEVRSNGRRNLRHEPSRLFLLGIFEE